MAKKAETVKNPQDELIDFCPKCFASTDNASWGGPVCEAMCANCGASGYAVKIPRFAVEEIRRSASWVGKRYYPADEDHERYEEREALLKLVKEFPGRKAERAPECEGPNEWRVSQSLGGGRCESVYVTAGSEQEALEKARSSLTYMSEVKP